MQMRVPALDITCNTQQNVELFGHAANLRNKWMTIGDQVTPDDDECWIYYRDTGMVRNSGGAF